MNITYSICKALAQGVGKVYFSLEVKGKENLIQAGEGGSIIAANHQSFLDPPLVAAAYPGEIHFLARETLFQGAFGKLIASINAVPISKEGADLASMKRIMKEVKDGNRVLVFPEGTRTKDGNIGSVAGGIGMIVAKSDAIVQPIRIEGAFEAWPKHQKRIKRVPISITIGKPVRFTEERKQKGKAGYQEIANTILEKIKEL